MPIVRLHKGQLIDQLHAPDAFASQFRTRLRELGGIDYAARDSRARASPPRRNAYSRRSSP